MTAIVEEQPKKKFNLSFKKNKEESDRMREEIQAMKQAKKDQKKREKEQAKMDKQNKKSNEHESDTESASTAEDAGLKKFFMFEKKKPRAEYEAEIEELKRQLAFANSDLQKATSNLQQAQMKINRFQQWARQVPM